MTTMPRNNSATEMRTEAWNTLNKIPIEVKFFSKCRRFPEGLYICQNFGIWSEYIQELRRSLECDTKNELKITQSRVECKVREDYVAFRNCIAKINHAYLQLLTYGIGQNLKVILSFNGHNKRSVTCSTVRG